MEGVFVVVVVVVVVVVCCAKAIRILHEEIHK